MWNMPPMLAYSIQGNILAGGVPFIYIVQGKTRQVMAPANPADDSYWIVILDANNPVNKVKEFVVPGTNNTVPAGLDTYMSNPAYLFAVVTQCPRARYVPQGDFYDYLVAHGAGRELQRLEQLNLHTGCGSILHVSYLLTGQGGPAKRQPGVRVGSRPPALLLMSLMPLPNGQPPYSLCDSYTFVTRSHPRALARPPWPRQERTRVSEWNSARARWIG